jgi:hypothetical protein
MTIYSKTSIKEAYARAIAIGATHDEAIASVAQAKGLPVEAVQAAFDEVPA